MANPIHLLSLALEAEGVRLRHSGRRIGVQLVLGIVALSLLMGVVVCGHIAGWYYLRATLPPHLVALILGGVDLLLAIILFVIAGRSGPGPIEREALALRRRALSDAAGSVSMINMGMQLLELWLAFRRKP